MNPAELSTEQLVHELDFIDLDTLSVVHELVMRLGASTFDGLYRSTVKARQNDG